MSILCLMPSPFLNPWLLLQDLCFPVVHVIQHAHQRCTVSSCAIAWRKERKLLHHIRALYTNNCTALTKFIQKLPTSPLWLIPPIIRHTSMWFDTVDWLFALLSKACDCIAGASICRAHSCLCEFTWISFGLPVCGLCCNFVPGCFALNATTSDPICQSCGHAGVPAIKEPPGESAQENVQMPKPKRLNGNRWWCMPKA